MKPAALLDVAPVLPPPEETVREVERQAHLEQALRTVQLVSRMAGRDLSVKMIDTVEDVHPDPAVYVMSNDSILGEISDAEFALRPTLLSGVADSAHTVLAGKLFIDDSGSAERIELPVAAKCFYKRTFDDRYARALQEVRIMQYLGERGELALQPIALAIAPTTDQLDKEVILVTRYDPGLLTLDNLPWGRGMNASNIENAHLAVAALGKFNTMGLVHGDNVGFIHGDAKIKNAAQDEQGRQLGMIDFETSKAIDLTDPAWAAEAALMDFGKMLDSLSKKGFFKPTEDNPSSPRPKDVMLALAETYLQFWAAAPPAVQSTVVESVDTAIALTMHL